jgi:outer membrane lipoprotein-sorting protein
MNELKTARKKGLPAIGAAALIVFCSLASAAPAIARAATSTAPATPPAAMIQAITALRDIDTMRADFTQTDANGQQLSGVLTLKRPGRIRFQYAPGVPMLIISDGHALIMIDSAVNQLQRWPIGNSPLGALLDPGRDVTRFGTLQPMLDPDVIGVDVRDPSHPEYGALTLVFARKPSAPGGMELTGWVATDSQNSRTVIRLSNQHYGMPVSDELFRYLDTRARPHK